MNKRDVISLNYKHIYIYIYTYELFFLEGAVMSRQTMYNTYEGLNIGGDEKKKNSWRHLPSSHGSCMLISGCKRILYGLPVVAAAVV